MSLSPDPNLRFPRSPAFPLPDPQLQHPSSLAASASALPQPLEWASLELMLPLHRRGLLPTRPVPDIALLCDTSAPSPFPNSANSLSLLCLVVPPGQMYLRTSSRRPMVVLPWSLTCGLRFLLSDLWPPVSGVWSLTFGLRSPVSDPWPPVSGLRPLASGLRPPELWVGQPACLNSLTPYGPLSLFPWAFLSLDPFRLDTYL
ncbi:hypothetical protein B0H11DRAFT_2236019 [Mycena galericulata]|nr:hypothetical protein B0H11DRAFT_2236019 [Mycena galericulata]